MTIPYSSILSIILTWATYLHTHLTSKGLWGLKLCSTLYLAGTECHVWLVTSEHRRNHTFLQLLCFKSFLSNSLYSYSPPTPFPYPPRSLGRESLGNVKWPKSNAHCQALPSVSVSFVTMALRGPMLGWRLLHRRVLQPLTRRMHKRAYQTNRSGHCSLLCPS